MGQAEHLLEIGRDDDDADASLGLRGDQVVDGSPRADVDAAGRLVGDEDAAGRTHEPAANRTFC